MLGCVVVDFSGQQYCHDQSCDDERGACFFLHFVFLLVALLPAIAERLLPVLLFVFLPFRFVATASILARRSARFSVGFRLNACVFSPVQAPLKKPASRLALRMSWLYFVTVDVLLYALVDILS